MEGADAPADPRQRLDDLRGQDLTGRDLTTDEFRGLLPEHLAGTILTGATPPPEIAKFPALEQVKAISGEARKVFIGLLAACVYCWLVIGTTTDVALILNTAISPLPIINTPVPIANFYVVGAAVLAAVYCYLHFYLLRLWRTLSTLPAVFPDGTPLDDRTDPWLLTNLVRSEFPHLRATAPPLTRLENLLTIALAWWLVPLTLVALWARYLPAHDIGGLVWLSLLIAITIFFGWQSFHLARATLNREVPSPKRQDGGESRRLFLGILSDVRHLRPDHVIVWLFLPFFIFINLSGSALVQSPRDSSGNIVVFSLTSPWDSLQKVNKSVARFLNFVGIRTYADLREVEVAERPQGWDGEDVSPVRRVDLRGRNLAFADLTRAFLPNADLRGANLTGAILVDAELRGAVLYDGVTQISAALQGANLVKAQLQGTNLTRSELQGTDLDGANLQGADLGRARLQGAKLVSAHLQGADLEGAHLQGAELREARLQGADLRGVQLQGANLDRAQLQGSDLRGAQLQGADLRNAQLQGADLRSAALSRAALRTFLASSADYRAGNPFRTAELPPSGWEGADLRGAHVRPMENAEIDGLIVEATSSIPDVVRRKALFQHLTATLRTDDRPVAHQLPGEWRSAPNVMFELSDPAPKPFDWGTSRWPTAKTYDDYLARLLADLACDRDVPQPQTNGLASRALLVAGPPGGEPDRLWPRLFADRVLGPDCPPASGLPEDLRRNLERLAAEL